MNPENSIFYLSLFVLLILFVISFYNYLTAPRITVKKEIRSNKFVSVLIPARNEETNIKDCINSVLNQKYKNFEVFVLDDDSTDDTYKTVQDILLKSDKIKLMPGKPLPEGWLGKNWACSQLAENANGEIFLFIDADVRLSTDALNSSLELFQNKRLNMLSCFPTQEINTIGERLIVPLMNYFLLSLLPLKKVFSSGNKSFAAANGQFVMIDKITYNIIGGHRRIKNEIVEDMELARLLKIEGFSILTALGDKSVYCRMYDTFNGSFRGFSKNFFPGFKTNFLFFLIMIFLYSLIFIYPFFLLANDIFYLVHITLIIMIRIFISLSSRQNVIINIILHPLQIVIMLLIAINSVWQSKMKKIDWKGRKL
ncbi:MAG: glycosyltransferase family 2 protein [Ignavibacteriaceae bacterium]